MILRPSWIILAVTLVAITPSRADDCGLKIASSIALDSRDSKLVQLVPVKINGADKRFLLDTGGYTTQISRETVDALQLPSGGSLQRLRNVKGEFATGWAKISDFQLGSLNTKDISVVESPGLPSQADGLLSVDMMLAYDLDLDFGNEKLNLISSDHCPGKVVYWPATAVATVPLSIRDGHYLIDVSLDGRHMVAIIDTGASHSAIGKGEALQYFGLSPDSPGMEETEKANGVSRMWLYKFGALSFDGVEVRNPSIAVIESALMDQGGVSTDSKVLDNRPHGWTMLLGMDIMRHLHMYISTKERKVYITPG